MVIASTAATFRIRMVTSPRSAGRNRVSISLPPGAG
jgi:hypothetical protein